MPGTPWPTAAPPAGSTPTSSTAGQLGEAGEDADGVGAAADARRDDVGVAPEQRPALLAGLVADHAVELAHHPRVRVRAHHRAEQVVARLDRGHPVAHRLVDGVLERAAARRRRAHLGAEQAHAEHVERLALHVDLAHVDDALEAEQRGGGGGGHAVLAGAGLGDDAALAHALGEQRLAEHVVDLVRAGVVQVLALEQQPAARAPRTGGGPRRAATAGRRSRAAARRARRGTPGRPTPRGTRRRARRRPGPASRGRTARRTRRTARSPPGSPITGGVGQASHQLVASSSRRGGSSSAALVARGRAPARRRGGVDEGAAPCVGSLTPGADSTPVAHVDAPRAHPVDGLGHVVGGEAAGQHQPQARRRALGERPVEHLARAGAGRVEQDDVGAVGGGAWRSSGSPPGKALMTSGTRSRTQRVASARLVAVELRGRAGRPAGRCRPPARAPRRGTRRR